MRARLLIGKERICQIAIVWYAATIAIRPALASKAERLHFPPDRAVGVVQVRPPRPWTYVGTSEGWHFLAPARGDVIVPRGNEVRLDVSPAASDLAFLSALEPDDVWALSVNFAQLDVPQLRAISRLRGLRYLVLGSHVADEHLGELGLLPRLVEIDLSPPTRTKPESLVRGIEWLASLPELKSLGLMEWRLPDATIESLVRCRKLEALTISIGTLKDQHLQALASIPQLRWLELWPDGTATGKQDLGGSFAHFASSRSLESLRVSADLASEPMLRDLSKVATLKSLGFTWSEFPDEVVSGLRWLKQIRKLELRAPRGPAAVRKLAEVLASLPELRVWPKLAPIDEHILELITRSPQIESLALGADGNPISKEQITRLGDLAHLRELTLGNFPLDDEELASLSGLKSLESLDLSMTNCSGVGFRRLKDLPKLNRVWFTIGDGIRPRIESLFELPHVTSLMVSSCDLRPADFEPLGKMRELTDLRIELGLTDDTTAAHLAGLKDLENLSLDDSVMNDYGLRRLLKLKNLAYLRVGGALTDDAIQQLSALPRLRALTVNSNQVTEAGLERLKRASPSLRYTRRVHPARFGNRELSVDAQGIWRAGDAEARRRLDPLEGHVASPLAVENWYDTSGRKLTLDHLRGKVVLLDFWGVWCGPCVAALTDLQRIHDKYRGRDFEIIGVHSTRDGIKLPEFAVRRRLGWPLAVDVSEKTAMAYRVVLYPALYLIDRQGVLRTADPHPYQLDEQIDRLQAEPVMPTLERGPGRR
jgi:thiol-disulfide isomerase/thioredoxin/Leucine-rich repeat (LRR) protein